MVFKGKNKLVCKPGSVVNGYLSRRGIAPTLQPPFEAHRADALLRLVLLRIEFTGSASLLTDRWALTPPFHPYRKKRRYISVALVRGSPLAGVTCYPCPTEPGLSSRKALSSQPRGCPTYLPNHYR